MFKKEMCAGFGIMHNSSLASNPYGLTALSCTWAFVCGAIALTAFKYASFLAYLIFVAMIYNQFSYARVPGATGTKHYYTARLSEYGIGMAVAFIFTLLDPWWVILNSQHLVSAW